jgi:hypothetical protein
MGLLAVAAHVFDAWCVTRVGVTAASSMILLLASLASGTITQVGAPTPQGSGHHAPETMWHVSAVRLSCGAKAAWALSCTGFKN